MYKLRIAILKDLRILLRDKAGLAVMFAMPVLLVVIITSIQSSSFEMVNNNKVAMVLANRDGGQSSRYLEDALNKIGMFELVYADSTLTDRGVTDLMHATEAVVAITIPKGFSNATEARSNKVADKALKEFGIEPTHPRPVPAVEVKVEALTIFYNPIIEESFRLSVKGALRSAQQFVENKQVLQALYTSLNGNELPAKMEKELLASNEVSFTEIPVAKDGSRKIPNVTQHNVPAWTIFAMFFIVVGLSTGLVKEKLNGSFARLKTLPTSYVLTITAKQITYLLVTLAQVAVVFSLGIYLFPSLKLPALVLPPNLLSLLLVSVVCGWCAVSYGVVIGVFARTMEQAIGFGAVSVVILAAIGGIVVPSFAMPETLRVIMLASPMHWCLEAYQTLFLEGAYTADVLKSLLPLFAIIGIMQLTAAIGLKRQNLI